ncbi:hypothetical protein ACM66B_001233 [Microbotryomycetes sp. NB124-2]
MEEADKAAEGLEGRLDHLLGEIDGMLDILEPGQDDQEAGVDAKVRVAESETPSGDTVEADTSASVKVQTESSHGK